MTVPSYTGWSQCHRPQHTKRTPGCTCGWKGTQRRSDKSGRGIRWLLSFDHRRHLQDVLKDLKAGVAR